MQIEEKKIKDLKPWPKNPRKSTPAQEANLKQSLEKFGVVEPIIFNKKTGYIVGGHFRVRELKKMGVESVPCVIVDLSEADEKELNIRLNANTGEWDWESLSDWSEPLEEWGLDFPADWGGKLEAKEDDYEIPETIETDIMLGDLFEIGEHRLLCGDTRNTNELAILMNSQFADMVLTDPPYNVDYTGKTKDTLKIQGDKKKDPDFYQFLYDFYTALGSYTKSGGSWYVWHADSEGANFRKAMSDAGIMVKQCLIWVKSSKVMGRQDYQWKHEPCLYGWKEGAAHGWYSDRKQTTVLEFDRPNRNAEHPTMKPIPLFAYQIGNSSKQGDIVADGFLGSGTTMVACEQLNRKCYGMEIDPKYCQVIIDRMKKLDPTLIIKKNGVTVNKQ